jgi:prepilin-type N-terminal cleavage/methylation domain-containing protein
MKKGFTLIELIVVITIIAILTVVGVVSYGGVNKKSRDSRRMADLEKYRVALEMARQVGGTYPATIGWSTTLVNMNLLAGTVTDPKTGAGYSYTRGAGKYTYTIDAGVEDVGSTNVPGSMIYRVTNP